MTRSKWLTLGALVLVALSVAWYFGSPWYTLRQIRSAAEGRDADQFATYIDFPALREDMKAELMAQLMAESQKSDDQFSGLGVAFGTALIGPMVDGMISPAGVKAMFMAGPSVDGAKNTDTKQAPSQLKNMVSQDEPVVVRRGLSEFLVASKDDPKSGVVFKRDGLGWKLSGIELPADATSRPSQSQR